MYVNIFYYNYYLYYICIVIFVIYKIIFIVDYIIIVCVFVCGMVDRFFFKVNSFFYRKVVSVVVV